MKTKNVSQAHRSPRRTLRGFVFGCALVAALCHTGRAATTMTGLVETSTDAAGNFAFGNVWSTHGNQSVVDIFVIGSSDRNGPFINGPSDAEAAISIPLSPGTHTFTMFAGGGAGSTSHGLNIFFNGNSLTPGISVFGPSQTSANLPSPSFGANGGLTRSLDFQPVSAANSLSYMDGENLVTLTGYSWANPSVYNLDRVTQPFVGFSSVGPDGRADWVGQFTFNVTPVPEPSACALLGLGAFGLFVQWFRTHPHRARSCTR